ncbi:MAG TPA: hypothetical protein VHV27_03930 [Phenylobacterium sp.]|nr:hypothetical protein [Phenylobacterium sp.]
MAEGLFGRLLGGLEDAPEIEAGVEGRAEAEAFAAAVAADLAKGDPSVAAATTDFLREQSNLLKIQAKRLQDEHALRLSHLDSQVREDRLRRVGQRIRIGMQVFGVLVITVIGLGVVVMLHDTFTSRTVVVDAFDAPPALAVRGISGKVVAGGVLDALQKLQQATRSATKALNTESAWASDVKIEVPETGVSVGEVNRMLHARFGHDVHIDGDLVQAADGGLALTVRGDGVDPKTFSGPAADLAKLTAQAAEYIYGQSQPYEFSTYLIGSGRYDDDLAFLPGAFLRAANDDERAELANSWANAYASQNKAVEATEKYRLAISLKPYNWKSWGNLVGSVPFTEGEEAAWREYQAMLRAADRAPKRNRPSTLFLVNGAAVEQDWPLQLTSDLEDAKRNRGAGAQTTITGPAIADVYAHLHDPAQAQRYMALSDPSDPVTKAEALLLPAYLALDHGDAAAAVAPLEAFWKAWQADPNLQYTYNLAPCVVGAAYGLTGRMAQAEAVFKRAGRWATCYGLHGDVLAHAGDLAGAERVWSEGIRVGPDLSPVYLERGTSELARGDLKRAAADLAAASARSPHWADPLKAWGDVLARQGQSKAALSKYDEALKYAPAWAALRQARAAVANAV